MLLIFVQYFVRWRVFIITANWTSSEN